MFVRHQRGKERHGPARSRRAAPSPTAHGRPPEHLIWALGAPAPRPGVFHPGETRRRAVGARAVDPGIRPGAPLPAGRKRACLCVFQPGGTLSTRTDLIRCFLRGSPCPSAVGTWGAENRVGACRQEWAVPHGRPLAHSQT